VDAAEAEGEENREADLAREDDQKALVLHEPPEGFDEPLRRAGVCGNWLRASEAGMPQHQPAACQKGAKTMSDAKTLYERLGGYDAIAAVANDLLPRLQADPQLGRF